MPRYLLDGNALGGTAVEAFHRRKWIEPSQPDSITVSIGYPLTDTAYSPQRNIDFQPPTLDGQPPATFPVQGAQPGGEEFLFFIESILRPWVRSTVFPNVHFKRDGLYGHSLGGMFTSWVLLSRPDLFDTFIVGSPALLWNNNALISNYSTYLNTTYQSTNSTKPALKVTYGSLEADPVKRRTETDEEFETRKEFYASFSVGHNAEAFYGLVDASVVRNKEFQLYPGSDVTHLFLVALSLVFPRGNKELIFCSILPPRLQLLPMG